MTIPHLIETMRLRADGSVDRLQGHLDRLSGSADALGLRCDIEAITAAVAALPAASKDRRLRLELRADGQWTLDTLPLPPVRAGRIWRLRFAKTRLCSGDPLLKHKTNRRDLYERARREYSAEVADEVLLLNERGEICEGTITSVFLSRGPGQTLATPSLSCGLLKGVLRQELIDSGRAHEAVLLRADFEAAERLYVGNSLRGLLPAQLAHSGRF